MWKLLVLTILVCSLGTTLGKPKKPAKNTTTTTTDGTEIVLPATSPSDMETSDICDGAFNRFKHATVCLKANLLRRLLSSYPTTTTFISPLAVMWILCITLTFSTGTTRTELQKVTGLKTDEEISCVLETIRQLLVDLEDGMELYAATNFYANSQYNFTSNFRTIALQYGFGESNTENFTDPESATRINELLASQTEDQITEVISSDDYNSTSQIVVVSGISYQFNWAYRFNESETVTDYFQVNPCKRAQAMYLHQTQAYRYYNSKDFGVEVLEIPFLNPNYKLLLILPNVKVTVRSVLKKLRDYKVYNFLIDNLELYTVDAFLLYKNLTFAWDIRDTLVQTGIVTSIFFPEAAKFNNVVEGNVTASVSAARQEAMATYTTEGGDPPTDEMPTNTVTFKTDRPFISITLIGGIPAFGSVVVSP